jgi:hypothetical protein
MCNECFKIAKQEDMDKIIQSQIVNWGIDIAKQLNWYYTKAVHLKIIKWDKDKNAIQAEFKKS